MTMIDGRDMDFPKQKIPTYEKTPAWAAKCIDWIIAQGVAMKDVKEMDKMYSMLQGVFDDEDYRKTLNPYNSTQEKFTRFPATMKHYDMFKGIIRRYVSEYIKSPHNFMVGANNPEVVLARDTRLRKELAYLVEQQIAVKIQESYQQWLSEGNDPEGFNPQQAIDIESFVKQFNKDYIDEISAQGQELLNVIRDISEDALLYAKIYFDFVTFGECYSYTEVIGSKLIKEHVNCKDAFPIHTDNFFKEDDDAFARRKKMTYSQIIDTYGDYMDEKKLSFIDTYFGRNGSGTTATELAFSVYESYFPEVCDKYDKLDRAIFKNQKSMVRENNGALYDVWHVVWRGFARKAIVTFVNEAGFLDTRIENDDYELNVEIGDISIEYEYKTQVHEGVRIGGRSDAIYPYDARAIAFDRDGKLPYNGISELLQGFGKFSIIQTVAPYNIFYNIVAYHREMAIAKNKLSILLIAKSLLGIDTEDTIYKILADGVIYYDDTNDRSSLLAQQVRMLNATNSQYINELSNLLMTIEQNAKDQVDMTPQRYGEIANSAGKGVTDEAIIRGSMGSVIIEFVIDRMRERDYARDMDFCKLAWIDGLNTAYRDETNNIKYVSLNVENHIFADYIIKAKDSVVEREKMAKLEQLAFNASQNGDLLSAVAAIEGDNIASISKQIKEFQAAKDAHEQRVAEIEQETERMRQEFEKEKIGLEGEQDRETERLKGIIEKEIQLIKADANMISFDNGVSEQDKQAGAVRLQQIRNANEKDKIAAARENNYLNAFSKAEDRRVKEKAIDADIKIADMNRNRYDTPKKTTKKK